MSIAMIKHLAAAQKAFDGIPRGFTAAAATIENLDRARRAFAPFDQLPSSENPREVTPCPKPSTSI